MGGTRSGSKGQFQFQFQFQFIPRYRSLEKLQMKEVQKNKRTLQSLGLLVYIYIKSWRCSVRAFLDFNNALVIVLKPFDVEFAGSLCRGPACYTGIITKFKKRKRAHNPP